VCSVIGLVVFLGTIVGCAAAPTGQAEYEAPKIKVDNVTVTFAGKEAAVIDVIFRIDNPNAAEIMLSDMLSQIKVQGIPGFGKQIAGALSIPANGYLAVDESYVVTASALTTTIFSVQNLPLDKSGAKAAEILAAIKAYPFKLEVSGSATFVMGSKEETVPFSFAMDITKPQ
jgi:LEA14-like dessication related protein